MSKTTTTKTTATTTTNSAKTNESVETLLTVTELKKFFVDNGLVPKYTDSTHYVGCGTRANVFSVNALKTRYNIYCNDTVFESLETAKITDCEYTANGNATDKTRNNMVVVKTTDALKKCIDAVKTVLPQCVIA